MCSISCDRPEMLKVSVDSIKQCRGIENVDWYLIQDGPLYFAECLDLSFDYIIARERRVGLSCNILWAIEDLFAEGYKKVIVVEDDIVVSKDFLEFAEMAGKLKRREHFTISGLSNCKKGVPGNETELAAVDWYHPWGVVFDEADFEVVKSLMDEYFNGPLECIKDLAKRIKDEAYVNKYLTGHINTLQAGYINTLRKYNRKKQILPCMSRCQNIGYYGFNQHQKKHDGADLSDESVRRRSMHYTNNFRDDYKVKKMRFKDVK